MTRCKYGRLKNPVGGRRCKQRRAGAKRRRGSRPRARKAVRWPFILAGLGALALFGASQTQEA
jgi:hypothetical protein